MTHACRLLLSSLVLLALPLAVRAEPPAGGAPAPVPTVSVPTYPNSTCPIMGKPASLALFAETPTHGRIYVCCPPCIAKIAKEVEDAYRAAYPLVRKVGNSVCPVTDKPLGADATSVLLQGYEIRVCATCARQAEAHSQVVLAKALNPRVVEVRNRTCPVTGQPVVPNAFCLVGDELIHLASPKAVDEVRKDPVRFLRLAKEIVARQDLAQGAPAPGTGR